MILQQVCQEEFAVNGKAKVMPCGHFFHYDCLMEWLGTACYLKCRCSSYSLGVVLMHFGVCVCRAP